MKHIAVVALSCVFAVGVVGQQQPAAASLYDQAVAAEQQEHDLDKALRLYREAFDKAVAEDSGDKLRAGLSLFKLLRRLGRDDEVKAHGERLQAAGLWVRANENEDAAQDPEREKELREKARELLQGSRGMGGVGNEFSGLPPHVSDQLLWIGAAAVPELIAELAIEEWPDPEVNQQFDRVRGILKMLWRLRGPRADGFLQECAAVPERARVCAQCARTLVDVDVESSLLRAYLDNPDDQTVMAFLGTMQGRLPPATLLEAVEGRGAAVQERVLLELSQYPFDAGLLPRAYAVVRRALAGADPRAGRAADTFLCSERSQRDVEGLRMLLERLPALRQQPLSISAVPAPKDARSLGLSRQQIEELLPAIDACVKSIADGHGPADSAHSWLVRMIGAVVAAGGPEGQRLALTWWDRRFDLIWVFRGHVDAGNAAAVFARLPEIEERDRGAFLGLFDYDGPVPAELFESLAAVGDEVYSGLKERVRWVGRKLVRTGDERVVPWLLEQWRADYRQQQSMGERTLASPVDLHVANEVSEQLIGFGREHRSEVVREAMLEMLQLRPVGGYSPDAGQRARLLTALMAMGDARALEFFVKDEAYLLRQACQHPYLPKPTGYQQTPLQYLLMPGHQPPHGYNEDQVVATVSRLLDQAGLEVFGQQFNERLLSDRVVVLLADHQEGTDWDGKAVYVLDSRLTEGGDPTLLRQWFERRLTGQRGDAKLISIAAGFESLHDILLRHLPAIVDGPNEVWAEAAAKQLWSDYPEDGLAQALKNKFATVRYWAVEAIASGLQQVDAQLVAPLLHDESPWIRASAAKYLGDAVHRDAVPDLIAALRDSDGAVRTSAAKALEQIRFYHDQQAHWDRVNKGMDATPASACEKLLLQAKPGQPAAQRLLAVESLGTLGVPEALPFLIDWTTDPDEAVAKAARAAITAIHLTPRR